MTTETYRGSDERWQQMWSHREQLLKVARRRSMSQEDAEDAVHEAMLRAAQSPHVDDERLGAWLTTVTVRLCVDRYRQVNRETEVGSLATRGVPAPVTLEEAVCDRAEAAWLAGRSGELPARQAEALRLKSQDLDVEQVACRMGLSYRAVESLLARARRALRQSLAATFGLALWLCGRAARPRGGGIQAAAAVSTAATLTVLGLAVPYVRDVPGPAPRPERTATSAEVRGAVPGAPRPSQRADRPGAAPAAVAPTAAAASSAAVPSRGLPLPEVSVPEVSALPDALPDAPPLPAVPSAPAAPSVSPVEVTVPVTPPALPGLPEVTAPTP